ncbi:glutaredoxin domain-containing cysteine-rich protein 2 [Platichthys flesus]|uniref:glutaredoxin domain-containing cysteine-rich protein 2 n=1 Tax=Platichthys flesus TaxID=8260 RepID=UPI002DB93BE3|nr:glutaredoxin domain-containing cysteine-rich protein 2 [Platichthys flesus]
MEELQRKLNQRYEGTKPRKVRFKLASSYSGRVLKHVYEDGQELDSPEEKYPHSFVHRKIPSHLEMEQLCGFQDAQGEQKGDYPPTGLIAQRINVYRGVGGYKPTVGLTEESEGDAKSQVLDFGKIIIYTSNLRIIRAPPRAPEALRQQIEPRVDMEGRPRARERASRRRAKSPRKQDGGETEQRQISSTETKEADSCQHCGGSGCAPCSLCHGSKLSMLANRFNESISDLRCQACYPHGLERCQSCSGK